MLVIYNHSPDYSLNCTPLRPISITYNPLNDYLKACFHVDFIPIQNQFFGPFSLRAAKIFSACFIAHAFLDQVYELVACVR